MIHSFIDSSTLHCFLSALLPLLLLLCCCCCRRTFLLARNYPPQSQKPYFLFYLLFFGISHSYLIPFFDFFFLLPLFPLSLSLSHLIFIATATPPRLLIYYSYSPLSEGGVLVLAFSYCYSSHCLCLLHFSASFLRDSVAVAGGLGEKGES